MANTVIPGMGFHHIALRVSDFDRSVAFYKETLGAAEVAAWGEAPGRCVMLDMGDGGRFEIFERQSGVKPDTDNLAGEWCHLALKTTDADLAYNRALAAGCTCVTEPKDVDIQSDPVMPVRIAFVAGFDGEVIEFFQMRG